VICLILIARSRLKWERLTEWLSTWKRHNLVGSERCASFQTWYNNDVMFDVSLIRDFTPQTLGLKKIYFTICGAHYCLSRLPISSIVHWLALFLCTQLLNVRWLPPLAAVLCGLLTIEHDWSRDHATSSVTAVLPPPDQHCGTVCLNSFGNRTSPLDSSNDRWKPLYLVSWATATCVWTLMAPTSNLLTYLLYKNVNESTSTPQTKLNQHKKY